MVVTPLNPPRRRRRRKRARIDDEFYWRRAYRWQRDNHRRSRQWHHRSHWIKGHRHSYFGSKVTSRIIHVRYGHPSVGLGIVPFSWIHSSRTIETSAGRLHFSTSANECLQSLTVHRCNCDRQLLRHRNVDVASVQSSSIDWLSDRNIRRYSYILARWNHRRYRFYLLPIQMILLINAWGDLPWSTVAEASTNRKHGVLINLTESEAEQTHRIVGHASVERVAIDWMWRNIFLLYSVAHDRRNHPETFWLKARQRDLRNYQSIDKTIEHGDTDIATIEHNLAFFLLQFDEITVWYSLERFLSIERVEDRKLGTNWNNPCRRNRRSRRLVDWVRQLRDKHEELKHSSTESSSCFSRSSVIYIDRWMEVETIYLLESEDCSSWKKWSFIPGLELTSYSSTADVGLPPDQPPQTNRTSCGWRGRAIGFRMSRSFRVLNSRTNIFPSKKSPYLIDIDIEFIQISQGFNDEWFTRFIIDNVRMWFDFFDEEVRRQQTQSYAFQQYDDSLRSSREMSQQRYRLVDAYFSSFVRPEVDPSDHRIEDGFFTFHIQFIGIQNFGQLFKW